MTFFSLAAAGGGLAALAMLAWSYRGRRRTPELPPVSTDWLRHRRRRRDDL